MKRRLLLTPGGSPAGAAGSRRFSRFCPCLAGAASLAALLGAAGASCQVLTVDTSGKGGVATSGPVDRRYAQVQPTHVELSKTELDPKSRIELIRALESEQGFAMRPFPRGHKGLTLEANGKLQPAGEAYLNMIITEGLSAKPGARVVITDIKFDRSRIILDFDGGPDLKHRILRHIQIGINQPMGDPDIDPEVAGNNGQPAGSRITLAFPDRIPLVTPADVKALLAPLISFDVKSPVQAFTDTLPAELKNAILGHKVLVGMTTDMVTFAKGQPTSKTREMEGQMPFEEWIYGTAPEEVDFVRINGNRVIRLEIAKDGEPLQIFTKDVVSAMLTTDGRPVLAANTRTIREGDVELDPNKQAPAAPPSLRQPGEALPENKDSTGVMRPVQFPKPHQDSGPGANPDEQPSTSSASPQQQSYPQGEKQSSATAGSPPANGSPSPVAPANAPPASASKTPASTSQLVRLGPSAQPD